MTRALLLRGLAGLLASWLLCGCPTQPEPPASPTVPPTAPGGDTPGQQGDSGSDPEATPPEPTQPAASPADPAEPTPTPAPTRSPETIALEVGGVHPLDERVAIGLSGFVTVAGRDLARVAVTLGAASFEAQLAPGAELRVGPGRFALSTLDRGGRRITLDPKVPLPKELELGSAVDLPAGSRHTFPAQGFYTLSDGSQLTVGNVFDVEGEPRVTLNLFPADYERNPMQDYARAYRAAPGAALGERYRVVKVEPDGLGRVTIARKK